VNLINEKRQQSSFRRLTVLTVVSDQGKMDFWNRTAVYFFAAVGQLIFTGFQPVEILDRLIYSSSRKRN